MGWGEDKREVFLCKIAHTFNNLLALPMEDHKAAMAEDFTAGDIQESLLLKLWIHDFIQFPISERQSFEKMLTISTWNNYLVDVNISRIGPALPQNAYPQVYQVPEVSTEGPEEEEGSQPLISEGDEDKDEELDEGFFLDESILSSSDDEITKWIDGQ